MHDKCMYKLLKQNWDILLFKITSLWKLKDHKIPAPPPLCPFSPPDLDRRVYSPALSGRGSRPSGRTSGWGQSHEDIPDDLCHTLFCLLNDIFPWRHGVCASISLNVGQSSDYFDLQNMVEIKVLPLPRILLNCLGSFWFLPSGQAASHRGSQVEVRTPGQ